MNLKDLKMTASTIVIILAAMTVYSGTVLGAGHCQKVKAVENGSLNPDGSGATGTFTQGGRLNGASQVLLASPFAFTADPYTFTFTDNLTLTTNEGVLRTSNVSLIDLAHGVSTAIARIDPNTSEGIFAGATGVLYLNGKMLNTPGAFRAEISGEICYAD